MTLPPRSPTAIYYPVLSKLIAVRTSLSVTFYYIRSPKPFMYTQFIESLIFYICAFYCLGIGCTVISFFLLGVSIDFIATSSLPDEIAFLLLLLLFLTRLSF